MYGLTLVCVADYVDGGRVVVVVAVMVYMKVLKQYIHLGHEGDILWKGDLWR